MSAALTRLKVLLAEPHKQLREALEEALSDVFEILPSGTANGTMLGFQRHRPAAVLIAMKQTDGHGLDLCKKLREGQGDRRACILVYGTAPDLADDVLEGDIRARYGPDRYMPRGVTIKKLDMLLREQLKLGWKKMDSGSEPAFAADPDKPTDSRWDNPMTTTDVVSAKNPESSSGIFRRLFKR